MTRPFKNWPKGVIGFRESPGGKNRISFGTPCSLFSSSPTTKSAAGRHKQKATKETSRAFHVKQKGKQKMKTQYDHRSTRSREEKTREKSRPFGAVVTLISLMLFSCALTTIQAADSKIIAGVPIYTLRHGCVPTAVGMVVGYYDTHGYPDLIPGDAATQTEDVNQAIASQGDATNPRHYEDYSLPLDPTGPIVPDKSELPAGNQHPDDCLADFMGTSRSALGLHYLETWADHIGPGFVGYVNYRNPSYGPYFKEYHKVDNTLGYWEFIKQIDNDRPMVFVIDQFGTGKYDQAVTVVGYKRDGSTLYYGCYDTLSTEIKWFSTVTSPGQPGAVWGGVVLWP
jgi:hypothetical protein